VAVCVAAGNDVKILPRRRLYVETCTERQNFNVLSAVKEVMQYVPGTVPGTRTVPPWRLALGLGGCWTLIISSWLDVGRGPWHNYSCKKGHKLYVVSYTRVSLFNFEKEISRHTS
jgi:hypothetical protein